MVRRILNLVLLGSGAVLLAWLTRHFATDSRRVVVAIALTVLGMLLNLTGLLRRTLPLRPWLRGLALGVGGVIGVGILILWYALGQTQETLDPASKAGFVAEETSALWELLLKTRLSLLWLAAALGYVTVAVALLPGSGLGTLAEKSSPPPSGPSA